MSFTAKAPKLLRVSIGLGLATAAITSTLRSDPGLISNFLDGGVSQALPSSPGAGIGSGVVTRPPIDVDALPARDLHPRASRSAFRHPPAVAPVHPAGRAPTPVTAERSRRTGSPATAKTPVTAAPVVAPPEYDDVTPIYQATSEELGSAGTPIYQATAEAVQGRTQLQRPSAAYQHPDDHLSAHRDDWRTAGHRSGTRVGDAVARAPRHRQPDNQ